MLKKLFRLGLIAFFALSLAGMQACKKSSGDSNTPGQNLDTTWYLTAKINGKPWAANVNLKDGAAAYAGGSGSLVLVVALQVVGKDTTAIEMSFSKAANINFATNFNPQNYSVLAYGTAAYAYGTNPQAGANGSFTITSLSPVDKIAEGVFSATLIKSDLSDKITITEGRFKCPYDPNAVPPSGGTIKE